MTRATWFQRFLGPDVGVDLGSATTRLVVMGRGIVLDEPSLVAVRTNGRKVLAAGRQAQRLADADPQAVRLVRPVRDGFGTDREVTSQMLRKFFRQAGLRWWFRRPRLLLTCPSRATEDQGFPVLLAAAQAGAGDASRLDAIMAGAIGAGFDPLQGTTAVVVGLGAGIAEVAVVSGGAVPVRQAPRCQGSALDEAIARYLRRTHQLLVTDAVAEEIKFRLGAADDSRQGQSMAVTGRDVETDAPRTMEVAADQIATALARPLDELVEAVLTCVEMCPRELLPTLATQGVILVGGGALLPGIGPFLAARSGLPVRVGDEPLLAVARGVAEVLAELPGISRALRGRNR